MLKVKVKKVTPEMSELVVTSGEWEKGIEIKKTEYGHSYTDFTDWDITDEEYYNLEELVDDVIRKMVGNATVQVDWE